MSNTYPSPFQIRAAMAGLKWEYKDLARASGVTVDTLSRICLEKHQATETTRSKLRNAFEAEGVEFTENDGIKINSKDVEVYKGPDRFEVFTEFMYQTLKKGGGDVCVCVTDERQFQKYRRNIEVHRQRMIDLVKDGIITGRILAGDGEFKETWAKIRRLPVGQQRKQVSFYVFGNYLALISFEHENPPYVVLHKFGGFAEEYREQFNLIWESAK